MIDIGLKIESRRFVCVFHEYYTHYTNLKKNSNFLMKKKHLIKSLLQEPPISKDCLRNSHFQGFTVYLKQC